MQANLNTFKSKFQAEALGLTALLKNLWQAMSLTSLNSTTTAIVKGLRAKGHTVEPVKLGDWTNNQYLAIIIDSKLAYLFKSGIDSKKVLFHMAEQDQQTKELKGLGYKVLYTLDVNGYYNQKYVEDFINTAEIALKHFKWIH